MKKNILYIIVAVNVLFLTAACQQETLRVTQDQQEDSFLFDTNLVGLVQGVTAHDGSHDNAIDGSSCFSINFPFSCIVDGEEQYYEQASDLVDLYLASDIDPVFPITVTYADYSETQINNATAFDELITQCASGALYNQVIRCVDFIYPLEVAVFDPNTSDFETLVFDHDRATFSGIVDLLDQAMIAQIQYPVQVTIFEGETLQIDSDEDLKAIINTNLNFCE
ncbi:hypothetical protein [Gilvibacter sediminis]|uniref:hypothetical protein n=1 Tax=Gilvibacter sediminis TaxID=379071 RepID=UPI0023506B35|nr:hypothetical protein [Gilvibacter sediminis]MDC7997671.1 hypothetical protein [Gilvibacter sediminis]